MTPAERNLRQIIDECVIGGEDSSMYIGNSDRALDYLKEAMHIKIDAIFTGEYTSKRTKEAKRFGDIPSYQLLQVPVIEIKYRTHNGWLYGARGAFYISGYSHSRQHHTMPMYSAGLEIQFRNMPNTFFTYPIA